MQEAGDMVNVKKGYGDQSNFIKYC